MLPSLKVSFLAISAPFIWHSLLDLIWDHVSNYFCTKIWLFNFLYIDESSETYFIFNKSFYLFFLSLLRISLTFRSRAKKSLYPFLSANQEDFQVWIYGILKEIGLTLCHIGIWFKFLKYFLNFVLFNL